MWIGNIFFLFYFFINLLFSYSIKIKVNEYLKLKSY